MSETNSEMPISEKDLLRISKKAYKYSVELMNFDELSNQKLLENNKKISDLAKYLVAITYSSLGFVFFILKDGQNINEDSLNLVGQTRYLVPHTNIPIFFSLSLIFCALFSVFSCITIYKVLKMENHYILNTYHKYNLVEYLKKLKLTIWEVLNKSEADIWERELQSVCSQDKKLNISEYIFEGKISNVAEILEKSQSHFELSKKNFESSTYYLKCSLVFFTFTMIFFGVFLISYFY